MVMTRVMLAATVVLFLSGCTGQPKTDPQIAELKAQIETLKAQAATATAPATATTSATATATAAATTAAAPSAAQSSAPAPSSPAPAAAAPPPAAGAAAPAITVVGRRQVRATYPTFHYDVISYWCVTYAVAGVGTEGCVTINTLDSDLSPSQRATRDANRECWAQAIATQPLPDCWPR